MSAFSRNGLLPAYTILRRECNVSDRVPEGRAIAFNRIHPPDKWLKVALFREDRWTMSEYDPEGFRHHRWVERDSFERSEQQREFLLWQRRRERCMSVWRSVASGLITAAVLAALSYGGHIVSWLIQGAGLFVTPLP